MVASPPVPLPLVAPPTVTHVERLRRFLGRIVVIVVYDDDVIGTGTGGTGGIAGVYCAGSGAEGVGGGD